jgi:hypothetical protein
MQAIGTTQSYHKSIAEIVQSTKIRIQLNTLAQQEIATLSQETNQAVKKAAE